MNNLGWGLRLPVVAAPMFLVSGPDLVIACCRAGIVGSFPTPNCRTTEELDQWLDTIASALKAAEERGEQVAPWAVNVVTHRSNPRALDDLALLAEYKVPIVITAMGSPKPAVEPVKSYGGMLIADVIDIALAKKAADAGVDGLACISAGAGGHTGHLSPFAFISSVRQFFDGLIAVGGGITSGAGIAGAIAAGADLVYMGTRFLASDESLAQDNYKQMIVDHGTDDLVVTAAITGTRASWLKPSLRACGIDPDALSQKGVERNYSSADNPQRRWKDVWAAGQGIHAIQSVQPTSEIVGLLAAEYREATQRFASMAELPARR